MAIDSIDSSTYKVPMLEDEVEVGDKDEEDFYPRAKAKRWGDECFVKIGIPTIEKTEPTVEDDKIKWVSDKFDIHFYYLEAAAQRELGGFEFEIILKEKPASNVVTFDFASSGLDFWKVPKEMTQDEIDQNAVRKPRAGGSYVFFHSTKARFFQPSGDAEKYRTGLAFWIPCPQAIDASKVLVDCDLNIDAQAGTMTVEIPQAFLNAATYPVSVDPDFGYTTQGASGSTAIAEWIRGFGASPESDGTATSITASVNNLTSGELSKCALFDGNDDTASLVSPQTEERSDINGDGWMQYDFTGGPSVLDANDYYVCAWAKLGTGATVDYTFASSPTTNRFLSKDYRTGDDAWPDPFGGTASGLKYSIYCTYSEGAAAAGFMTTNKGYWGP